MRLENNKENSFVYSKKRVDKIVFIGTTTQHRQRIESVLKRRFFTHAALSGKKRKINIFRVDIFIANAEILFDKCNSGNNVRNDVLFE